MIDTGDGGLPARGQTSERSAQPRAADGRSEHDFGAVLRRLAPAEDPALVEAWMRVAHGELASIEPLYFAREVKLAVERLHAIGAAASRDLARSLGLEPDVAAGATMRRFARSRRRSAS